MVGKTVILDASFPNPVFPQREEKICHDSVGSSPAARVPQIRLVDKRLFEVLGRQGAFLYFLHRIPNSCTYMGTPGNAVDYCLTLDQVLSPISYPLIDMPKWLSGTVANS